MYMYQFLWELSIWKCPLKDRNILFRGLLSVEIYSVCSSNLNKYLDNEPAICVGLITTNIEQTIIPNEFSNHIDERACVRSPREYSFGLERLLAVRLSNVVIILDTFCEKRQRFNKIIGMSDRVEENWRSKLRMELHTRKSCEQGIRKKHVFIIAKCQYTNQLAIAKSQLAKNDRKCLIFPHFDRNHLSFAQRL